MSKTNKETMRQIRRKLNRVIGKFETACGHEINVREALDLQYELEEYIEAALDAANDGGGK